MTDVQMIELIKILVTSVFAVAVCGYLMGYAIGGFFGFPVSLHNRLRANKRRMYRRTNELIARRRLAIERVKNDLLKKCDGHEKYGQE